MCVIYVPLWLPAVCICTFAIYQLQEMIEYARLVFQSCQTCHIPPALADSLKTAKSMDIKAYNLKYTSKFVGSGAKINFSFFTGQKIFHSWKIC
jgi:hypothetical protein